jgi:hypothetical protein
LELLAQPGVVGHRKTYFSESIAGVEGGGDIISGEGAIVRPIIRMAYRGASAGTTRC